jgi:hypothetical protein
MKTIEEAYRLFLARLQDGEPGNFESFVAGVMAGRKDAEIAAAEERGRREGAKWRFPREPGNAGGWTIRYKFLGDIQGIINDEYGIGAEEIEQVLLAVEKLPVPPAEKEANCIFEKTYNENWGGINRTSFIGR